MRVYLALQCVVRLLLVRALLACFGAHRTARWLVPEINSAETSVVRDETLVTWVNRANGIRRVAHFLPSTQCLARAVTLVWWARRNGLPAQLYVGVKRGVTGTLEAHAWTSLFGVVIDESAEIAAGFTRIPFPGSTSHAPC